jgi:hypothetical protein
LQPARFLRARRDSAARQRIEFGDLDTYELFIAPDIGELLGVRIIEDRAIDGPKGLARLHGT